LITFVAMGNKAPSLFDFSAEYRTKTLLSSALESGSIEGLKQAIQAVRSSDAARELPHADSTKRLLDYLTKPMSFQSDEEFIEEDRIARGHADWKRTPLQIALDMEHFDLGLFLRDEITRVAKINTSSESLEPASEKVHVRLIGGNSNSARERASLAEKRLCALKEAKNVDIEASPAMAVYGRNIVSAEDLFADDKKTLSEIKTWTSMVNNAGGV